MQPGAESTVSDCSLSPRGPVSDALPNGCDFPSVFSQVKLPLWCVPAGVGLQGLRCWLLRVCTEEPQLPQLYPSSDSRYLPAVFTQHLEALAGQQDCPGFPGSLSRCCSAPACSLWALRGEWGASSNQPLGSSLVGTAVCSSYNWPRPRRTSLRYSFQSEKGSEVWRTWSNSTIFSS